MREPKTARHGLAHRPDSGHGRRIAAPAEYRWRALCCLCVCDFSFVIFTSFASS
jgi:hypothetical protein